MQIEKTTTINIDGQIFDVSKMTPEIQQLVAYFDDWRQKEADAQSQLLLVRSGLTDLKNTLLKTIQEQRDAARSQAEALGIIPPADAPATNDEFVEVGEDA